MQYRLGKRPARPDAIKFKFASFFDQKKLPTPPKVFGHESIGRPFGMLANDRFGCCVWSGAGHETMVWGHESGVTPVFSDASVLSDYAAVTGFKPSDPDTDQGTDMKDAASYRRKVGIRDAKGQRHKIDSYVALHPGDLSQIAVATYLMGAVGIGLQLPDTAEQQFDEGRPWDVVPHSTILGGHYVPICGRNSKGNYLAITWGRLQAITPSFLARFMDEGVCYLSLEILSQKNLSPEGFDAVALRQSLAALAA